MKGYEIKNKVYNIVKEYNMENLVLPQTVKDICQGMIDEQLRMEVL
ncbi:MAG: hypothetical protein UFG06_10790 [Lachnospiraceae bacterium]|nr:hypothetical protein [Lachnospiraceae bacterium]